MTADALFEQLAATFAEVWATGNVDQALELARDASTLTYRQRRAAR
jgi:hypothetical protein